MLKQLTQNETLVLKSVSLQRLQRLFHAVRPARPYDHTLRSSHLARRVPDVYPKVGSLGVVDDPRSGIGGADDDGVFFSCEEGVVTGVVNSEVVRGYSGSPCECDRDALGDLSLKGQSYSNGTRTMKGQRTGVEIRKGTWATGLAIAIDAIARVTRVERNIAMMSSRVE